MLEEFKDILKPSMYILNTVGECIPPGCTPLDT